MSDATAVTRAICIEINEKIVLPNTTPSPPVCLKGKYVAFPEVGSDPRAYKLHEADDTWQAKQPYVAKVFIVVAEDGVARLS